MPPISNIGLYRGEIKDFSVGVTKTSGLPQFIATLSAAQMYDDVTEEWQDWTKFQEMMTGYFVLTTLDKKSGLPVKCLNYDQVMEAVGWDGETYAGLAAMDLKGKVVQFRVQEDTYEGNTRLKISWIAGEDAELGLKKLSEKDMADLDARFKVVSTKKPTPASPKTKKKTTTPKATPPKTTPPKATPPKVESEAPLEPTTEAEAYQACLDANASSKKPVPGEILDDYWVTHVTGIAADGNNVTGEEWAKIRDAVLEAIGIPF